MTKVIRLNPNLSKGSKGFALPVVLIMSVILVAILNAAINESTTDNKNSRINLLSIKAASGLESLLNQYKALLNDGSGGNIYHFFWLVQACNRINNSVLCPKGNHGIPQIPINKEGIQNPSNTFWSNTDDFCSNYPSAGRQNCLGRQIAPICGYTNRVNWVQAKTAIDSLYSSPIEVSRVDSSSDYKKHQNSIITQTRLGQIENGGRVQIDFSNLIRNSNSGMIQAEKRARVNINVVKTVPDKGFAYISAGYQQSDWDAINLSNLVVTGPHSSGIAKGTILLRKNDSPNNWYASRLGSYPFYNSCSNKRSLFFNDSSAQLPKVGNGGLLIFAPSWPTHKSLTKTVTTNSNKIIGINSSERIDKDESYNNLILLRGSTLYVETTDSKQIVLNIGDSLDVAPGARICNVRPGSNLCGSGKPENLAIVSNFNTQKNGTANKDDTSCSSNSGSNTFGEAISSRSSTASPGPTFTFRNTGRYNSNDSFSGFIYGKDLIFNSAGVPRGRNSRTTYLQEKPIYAYSGFGGQSNIFIHRGRLSIINYGGSSDTNIYTLLAPYTNTTINNSDPLRTRNSVSPYLHKKHVIAVARRQFNVGGNYCTSWSNCLPMDIYLTHNWDTDLIEINTFTRSGSNINLGTRLNRNLKGSNYYSIPSSFRAHQLSTWKVKYLLDRVYGIRLSALNSNQLNSVRSYKGAVWARRVCFSDHWKYPDYLSSHKWEFDSAFIDGLAKNYSEFFRFGYPYYRGRTISDWDQLRDFIN